MLYKSSIHYGIINPDITLENKLTDFIDSEIDPRKAERDSGIFYSRMYEVSDLLINIF